MHPELKTLLTTGFKNYSSDDIRTIRGKLGYSRKQFADMFFATTDTVKSWETGRRLPSCHAMRVLQFVEKLADEKHSDFNHRIRQAFK